MKVDHKHGYTDIAKYLDSLKHSTLIGVQLLGYRANVWFAADFDDGKRRAQRFERANGAEDIVPVPRQSHSVHRNNGLSPKKEADSLGNLRRALHPPPHNPLPNLLHLNQATILTPRLAADLDNTHCQLKVKVIDAAAQQLRPDGADAGACAVAAGGQWVNADGGAHAGELGAEGRVGTDVFGVGLGELLEERAEDAQLGLEGLGVSRAQGVAVAGVLGRGNAAAVEGGKANAFTRHFVAVVFRNANGMSSWCSNPWYI